MIAKLELELACNEELAYQMSSLFHGVLMELLLKNMQTNYITLSCIRTRSIWNAEERRGIG